MSDVIKYNLGENSYDKYYVGAKVAYWQDGLGDNTGRVIANDFEDYDGARKIVVRLDGDDMTLYSEDIIHYLYPEDIIQILDNGLEQVKKRHNL
jgi:hypothetical protein